MFNIDKGVGTRYNESALITIIIFVPHSNARALATTLTETVCFAVYNEPGTRAGDQFYGQIMAGVEQELRAHDYHLLVTTLDDDQLAYPEQWSPVQGMTTYALKKIR